MSGRYESPALAQRDPIEVARSAHMVAFGDEIDARAELARVEVLAEHHPASYAEYIEVARQEHAKAARNSARWKRLLALIEEDELLNGGGHGD